MTDKSPSAPKDDMIKIRVATDIKLKLQQHAKDAGMTLSDYLVARGLDVATNKPADVPTRKVVATGTPTVTARWNEPAGGYKPNLEKKYPGKKA